MAEPAPFKLKIDVECEDPDKLSALLEHIRETARGVDMTPSTKASVTFEAFNEIALLTIRAEAERYLRGKQWEMLGKVTLTQPLQRRPTLHVTVTARGDSPMDQLLNITGDEPEEPSGPGYSGDDPEHPDDTDY